jgi:ABC-2 type transport system ATP-binding protein
VIDHGRVAAEGTADDLKASVGTASLQLRLADPTDSGVARERIRRRLGIEPMSSPEASWLTVPLQDPERVTDLLVDLRDAGIRLAEFGVQKPTLDEVFLTITGHPAEPDAGDEPEAPATTDSEVLA